MATDTLTSPIIAGSATRPNVYKNFIDGEWVEAATGETFENRSPADVGIERPLADREEAALSPFCRHLLGEEAL